MRRLLPAMVVTGFVAYFAGGFVLGFVSATDAKQGPSILGRLLVGAVYCVISALSLGFPPADFSKGDRLNAWPYILGCWLLMMLLVAGWSTIRTRPGNS